MLKQKSIDSKKHNKTFKRIIIALVTIAISLISAIFIYKIYLKITIKNSPSYIYYNFRIPVELDNQAVLNSIENESFITIPPSPSSNICKKIRMMAFSDGWKITDKDYYTDGGSFSLNYYKSKDEYQVLLFCQWDTDKGEFTDTNLKFIKP